MEKANEKKSPDGRMISSQVQLNFDTGLEAVAISFKISATKDNWISLWGYLSDGTPELAEAVYGICLEKRIMGKDSGDKRKTRSRKVDNTFRSIAAVYGYVSYCCGLPEAERPEEFKSLLGKLDTKEIRDKRLARKEYLLRSIVYQHCIKKGITTQEQNSFEVQYFDNNKAYMQFAQLFVAHLFRNQSECLTIDGIVERMPERSILDIEQSIKSLKKSLAVKKKTHPTNV